jgi:hypothetical protein
LAVQEHLAYSAPRPRVKPVNVEVLRNGTSTESVSFIKSGNAPQAPMEEAPPSQQEPAASAAPEPNNESSDSFSSAAPAQPPAAASKAAFAASDPATGIVAHGDGSATAPFEVSGGPAGAAAGSVPSAGPDTETSYSGPRAKTIDVP